MPKRSVDLASDGLARNYGCLVAGLSALTLVCFIGSLLVGRMNISVVELLGMTWSWFNGEPMEAEGVSWLVFSQVRFPRCILAILVGGSLALSGAVYQGLFRNPLVSPNILGVSAGCTLGAALGLILPGLGFGMVRGLAFVLGLGAVFAALALARLVAVRSVIVLVLAGLVITSVLNALLMIIKTQADPYSQLPAIVFWIMGSLHRSSWQDLYWALPLMGGGYLFFHAFRFRLNVLSLGDDQARSLGTNPLLWRVSFICVSSLMVAFAVSTCGQIAWLGLVAPHMARTLVGPNHERMIPVTALLGAVFLLLADGLARTLTAAELPVSIITSLTGGPFFAYLLYKNRGSGWT